MIKATIFDLGNVLIPFDFARMHDAIRSMCPLTSAEIGAYFAATDLPIRFETGAVTAAQFFAEVSSSLHLRATASEFNEAFCSIFRPEPLIPLELIRGLRGRYRLVLLSNTNQIHYEMLVRTHPFLSWFDEHVLSFKVGVMKPGRRIFEAAIESARCAPQECFYTDDIAEYVNAAKELGIDAVRFHSAKQLCVELRARGVAWD
jgi:putative hydrolase of the HAD superfamily